MKNTKILLLFSILLIYFSSCNHTQKTSQEIISIPTPSKDSGVVTGFINTKNSKQDLQVILFLSKNITYNNPDLPPTISFSYQSNPRGVLDQETGKFFFSKVEPAENYVISVWFPPGNVKFVTEHNSKKPLQISVSAGNLTDVGIINLPDD